MKIARNLKENGVFVGNAYDKYHTRNPISRWMVRGFSRTLDRFVDQAAPNSIHEVGCGEGYWVMRWTGENRRARGSDFSPQVIEIARQNALEQGVHADLFQVRSIYDLDPATDAADLLVCCEVMEHLEDPVRALQALQSVVRRHLILSVPREPVWRLLNMARCAYWRQLGNTPGHLQHWSRGDFVRLVSRHFDVVALRTPLPWTMLLCRPNRRLS